MLSRVREALSRVPQPILVAGALGLASAIVFARRHPAGTVGGRGRSPPPSELEFEVVSGFPSTHAPVPAHAPVAEDLLGNSLQLSVLRKVATAAEATTGATAKRNADRTAVALSAATEDDALFAASDDFSLVSIASHDSHPTHEPFGFPSADELE